MFLYTLILTNPTFLRDAVYYISLCEDRNKFKYIFSASSSSLFLSLQIFVFSRQIAATAPANCSFE